MRFIAIPILLLAFVSTCWSDELKPVLLKKGEALIGIDHSDVERDKKIWKPYSGTWLIKDGVMNAKNVEQNPIAQAAVHTDCSNKIFQFRFRFVDDVDAFHLGFNIDRSETSRQGHLLSLVFSPKKVYLLNHPGKRDGKKIDEELDAKSLRIKKGKWMEVMLERKGSKVSVQIKETGSSKVYKLEGEDSAFTLKSPSMVFRVQGEGLEIDDVKVWQGE